MLYYLMAKEKKKGKKNYIKIQNSKISLFQPPNKVMDLFNNMSQGKEKLRKILMKLWRIQDL
jgi:hypothetical protein